MNWPEGWARVRLSDVLHRVEQKIDPQATGALSHFYVGLEDIESDTGRLSHDHERVTEDAEILSIKTVFAAGDILYGKLRPNLNKVYVAQRDGICSTDIWALRASSILLPEFGGYYLRSPLVRGLATQMATGANLPRISADSFDRIPILLPTLPEQQRIVDLFRQLDSLREYRGKACIISGKLGRQRFIELFGHPAENPRAFDVLPLGQFGTLDRGVSKHRPRDASHLYGGPYPFIQTGDVTNAGDWIVNFTSTYSEAGLTQSRLWPKGTLCITIAARSPYGSGAVGRF